jgi:hypothetical protein
MVLDGCAMKGKFAPTGASYQRSKRTPEQIELYLDPQAPAKPYVIVGIISTEQLGGYSEFDESLAMMRKKASEVGLDGILHINCSPLGAVQSGSCTGKGFVYQK